MYTPLHSNSDLKYRRFGSYLHGQHFGITVALAVALHLGGLGIYQLLPREIVEEIPVRVLNIKIGKSLTMPNSPRESGEGSTKSPVTTPKPAKPVPTVQHQPAPRPAPKPAKQVTRQEKATVVIKEKPKVTPNEATQNTVSISEAARTAAANNLQAKKYVREDSIDNAVSFDDEGKDVGDEVGKGGGEGSVFGNSTADSAEIESRYTQTLSLWFNRFKIYPLEARKAGIGGTVMLRIRIDRQGNIMRYYLEHPSGHAVIDQAINTMVNAANPVPAVPPYYPDSRPYLEFIVPIHFKP